MSDRPSKPSGYRKRRRFPRNSFGACVTDVTVLMVEAKTRKSVFLREALRALDLTRGDVVTSRFEELLTKPRLHEAHDLLTIRAVRIEARVLMSLQAFVRPSGELFLFRTSAGASGSDAGDAAAGLEGLIPFAGASQQSGCAGEEGRWAMPAKCFT